MSIKSIANVLACLATGAGGYWLVTPARPDSPSVEVARSVDVGTQDAFKSLVVSIPVTNRGRQPLRITNFRKTCGCLRLTRLVEGTDVEVIDETVPPGRSLALALQVQPKPENHGQFRHTIQFQTNDPHAPEVAIEVVGRTVVSVCFEPRQWSWNCICGGPPEERTLRVVDARPESARGVIHACCDAPFVKVLSVVPVDSSANSDGVNDCRTYAVRLEVKPLASDGTVYTTIFAKTTGGQILAAMPLAVSARAKVRLIPSVLVLPRHSEAGRQYMGRCLVVCDSPRATIDVVDPPAGVRFAVTTPAGGSTHVLEVQVDGNNLPFRGTREVTVAVRLDNTTTERLRLAVTLAGPDAD